MGWIVDLYRFTGRSGRRAYWVISIIATLAILTAAGVLTVPRLGDNLAVIAVAALAVLAALPALIAVSIRRLHDRNRSGWWMVLYFLLPVLFGPSSEPGDPLAPMPVMLQTVLALVSAGISIWAFVDLGVLRGRDPNRFGPDPQGAAAAAVFE